MIITTISLFFKRSLQVMIFSLFIFPHISSMVHASSMSVGEDNGNDTSTSSSSHSLVAYGGEEGNRLFQETSKKAIDYLAYAFRSHRDFPEIREEGDLRKYTLDIADMRAEIARKVAGAGDEKDFRTFRLGSDSEYATTAFFPNEYSTIRHFLQEKIVSLRPQHPNSEWVVEGSTRYRLRVLELKDWPTSCSNKHRQLYNDVLAKSMKLEQDHVKTAIYNYLDMQYFKDFLMKGSVYGEGSKFFGYNAALLKLAHTNIDEKKIRKKHKTVDVFIEDWKNLPLLPLVIGEIEQRSLPNPDKARLVRVDIEHKINDQYLPGYGLIGLIPNCNKIVARDISLMLCHPGNVYLPMLVEHYEKLLKAAILADSKNANEVLEKVGRFHNFWSITMPSVRGSAADGEWIAEAIYQSHGYTHTVDKTQVPSIDHASYMYWSTQQFLENYKKVVKLESVVQPNP